MINSSFTSPLGKPQIIVLKKHIPASIGDFLQLNVTFCSNDNTDPSVAWYRINGTSSTKIQNGTGSYVYQTTDTEVSVSCYSTVSRQSGYVTILTVANVKTFHFAKFSVQINNSLGSAEAEIIVSPRGIFIHNSTPIILIFASQFIITTLSSSFYSLRCLLALS